MPALGYGYLSDFAELPAGAYAVSLRAAGAAPSTPPALSLRVDLPPGGARTVALTGSFAELSAEVLPEDLGAPPPGSARVRALDATEGGGPAEVRLTGGPALPAGTPVVVPAGPWTLEIDGTDADLPLELVAGSVVTVVVLDGPGGQRTVRVVLDAAAPERVPVGAVEAGSGPDATPVGLLAGLAAFPATAAEAARTAVTTDPDARVAPTWLRIPAAGVDVALPAVGLDADGALVPPAEGAGWYAGGPVPGETGPAVITGHVDRAGSPAAFARLAELSAGNEIVVGHADGTTSSFTVTRVDRYAKNAFPTAAVYGATAGPELRLITCGGTFDRSAGSYRDNVVVSAVAAG